MLVYFIGAVIFNCPQRKRKTLSRFLKGHRMSGASLPNPHQRRFLKKAPLDSTKTFNTIRDVEGAVPYRFNKNVSQTHYAKFLCGLFQKASKSVGKNSVG